MTEIVVEKGWYPIILVMRESLNDQEPSKALDNLVFPLYSHFYRHFIKGVTKQVSTDNTMFDCSLIC